MRFFFSLIVSGAGLATLGSCARRGDDPFRLPRNFDSSGKVNRGIKWHRCDDETKLECGRFEVPLDYKNPSAGKGSLAVVRSRATKGPKIGTLFYNPGGPGESGVDVMLDAADDFIKMSGGKYDVVSWDPRGIGRTVPDTFCFDNARQESSFWKNTVPFAGIEAKGDFRDPQDLKAFFKQVPEVDKKLKQIGKQCDRESPNSYRFIGSVAAVRDMVAMHDYLEGSKKPVNFFGESYGTIIGVYFVNMFPDRVGRVIIDGVVDPEIWANRPAHELWNRTIDNVDLALNGFTDACAKAGPGRCAIATKGSTSKSVKQSILKLIDRAYDNRKKVGPNADLTSSVVRDVVYNGLYSPTEWPKLANTLKQMSRDLDGSRSSRRFDKRLSSRPATRVRWSDDWDVEMTPRGRHTTARAGNDKKAGGGHSARRRRIRRDNRRKAQPPRDNYNFQAIACADAADAGNITTKDVFDSLVDSARTASPVFGQLWSEAGLYCHNWPFRAVERFTGPFDKKLSNKIIVVGNTADPSTPLESAKRVAAALGDSAVLLHQAGFGHTSGAMRSKCTRRIMLNYFLNNRTPDSDTFCETDEVLFPPNNKKNKGRAFFSAEENGGNFSEHEEQTNGPLTPPPQ